MALHTRWKLEVPEEGEEALCAWLDEAGATAYYREADPPKAFFAYFPPDQEAPEAAPLADFGARLIEAERFADEDWLAKSREGFGAFEVGRGYFVRPLWEETPAPEGRKAIVVNPGLAFGTGGHETTRLCIELLETLADAKRLAGPVLDIGAGTGILALVAHHLGAAPVQAFDIDPDCGPAMAELVELNPQLCRHAAPFEAFVGTLDDARVQGPYQLLIANILLETIAELLPRMAEIAATGARLIASGILAERSDEALVHLAAQGFKPLQVLREGEWIAILTERA